MQRIFEKWLLLYLIIGCVISFGLSFHTETKQAQRKAKNAILQRIGDSQKIISSDEKKVNAFLSRFIEDIYTKSKSAKDSKEINHEKDQLFEYWKTN